MCNKIIRRYFYLLIGILITFASCKKATIKADLIISNAKIWTGNEHQMIAQSMAILGDSIIAVGSNEETLKLKGNETEIIDVKGGFITPGFIDAHVHLIGGGYSLLSVDPTVVTRGRTNRTARVVKSRPCLSSSLFGRHN